MDRKLPVKQETIELNGDYKGFTFSCWTNPPWGEFCNKLVELDKSDPKEPLEANLKLYEFLSYMVTGWDFVDREGKAIPFSKKGFDKVPLDLIRQTIMKAREVIEKIPLAPNAS